MIDIVFLILMIVAIVKGYQKGFIIALFSIIAYIVGIAVAVKLSATAAIYLQEHTTVSSKWLPVISFAVVFLIVVLLVKIGGKLIEKTFQMAMLGWANRLLGILLYVLLYTIIFSILLFYAEKIHLVDASGIQTSKTYSYIQPWGPRVIDQFGKIIPIFKGIFTELEHFFSGVSNKI